MSFFMRNQDDFGACCKDLKDALTMPQQKFFWVSDDGVLFLSLGRIKTEQGLGWIDHAVLFCPFCGRKLQTKEDVLSRSASNANPAELF